MKKIPIKLSSNYKADIGPDLNIQIDSWPGSTMICSQPTESWQQWPSKRQYLKHAKQQNPDYVFVPYYDIINNQQGFERLKLMKRHVFYDQYMESIWIRRGSTAHSLAIILGIVRDEKKK
jgi:hypothetical protein